MFFNEGCQVGTVFFANFITITLFYRQQHFAWGVKHVFLPQNFQALLWKWFSLNFVIVYFKLTKIFR